MQTHLTTNLATISFVNYKFGFKMDSNVNIAFRDVPDNHLNGENTYENANERYIRSSGLPRQNRAPSVMIEGRIIKKLKFEAQGIKENKKNIYVSFGIEVFMFFLCFIFIAHISNR